MLKQIASALDIAPEATIKEKAVVVPVELVEMSMGLKDDADVEIVQDSVAVDALSSTATALDNLSGECFATVENGGLSDQGLSMLLTGISATISITGTESPEMPSGESFGEEGNRVAMTQLAGESLATRAKAVWKKVRAFLAKIAKTVAKKVVQFMMNVDKDIKTVDTAIEKYKSFSGTTDAKKMKFSAAKFIMNDKKMATASQIVADVKVVTDTAKVLSSISKAIKGAEGKGVPAADLLSAISGLGKEASDADRKGLNMTEGYELVRVSDVLLSNSAFAIGVAKDSSDKGSRGLFVSRGTGFAAKEAKEEMDVLSIAEAQAMFGASKTALEASKAAADAIKELQDAIDAHTKKVDAVVKEGEKDEAVAKDAEKASKKLGDLQSIVTDAAFGLQRHAHRVGKAAYNVGLASLKKYKTEEKKGDE